ncbi:hypothetical protein [Methylobacterium oxalidis]|uniref:Uncharacterized protein n=1 Tax=Methylobacterium oxalidis TaxID=944322 RepID=A0A512IWY2_9HYPH|nr:hypothetical protein [Methylobacterium oxalidis]GEP02221.1 hypothetical protein MOX02_02590 [Methylobacterium oxalidis]GJE32213.1 hypothetical protein LDDCCGHA_2397 [Methylobacterium oxalidis]GLS62166.1 hypothetical protein GCM10007888_05470 [Methylobacterium oxalidis]
MAGHTQEFLATVLEHAWTETQAIRETTGIVVELRLTTIGLTAVANDFLCGRMATVSWSDLKRSDALPELLHQAITAVADQPRRVLRPVPAPERAAPAPREAAPARGQEGLRGRRAANRGRAKTQRPERKRSQV